MLINKTTLDIGDCEDCKIFFSNAPQLWELLCHIEEHYPKITWFAGQKPTKFFPNDFVNCIQIWKYGGCNKILSDCKLSNYRDYSDELETQWINSIKQMKREGIPIPCVV